MKIAASNFKTAIFLAVKSIRKGNLWTLALIITVISLIFASVILTPSIMTGVTKSMDDQQIAVSGNAIIQPNSDKYYIEGVSQIKSTIAKIPEVLSVSPRLGVSAFFEYQWQTKYSPGDRGNEGNWPVIGIDPSQDAGVTSIAQCIVQGNYLIPADRDMILIGLDIAGNSLESNNNLGGVQIGDTVRLTYPNGVKKEYTIKGIFQTHEMSADRTAFVTRDEIISVLGSASFTDTASQILVKFLPGSNEGAVLAALRSLSIDGVVQSWQEYGGSIGSVVSSFDMIASLISSVTIAVAAIVMFIVIYINVVNRRRQIGILRAIGINSRIILYSYLFQAVFYAVIGMIVGGLLFHFGIRMYFNLHPISLPIGLVRLSVSPMTVELAVLGIMASAIFAGIIPALTVIRQTIIKSIWGN